MATEEDATLVIGKINGVFGVKGWIKVFDYARVRGDVLQHRRWLLGKSNQWSERKIEAGQIHGKGVIAKLEGCDDRDSAAALLGSEIAVWRDWLTPTQGGQFYWFQLEGLAVRNLTGESLGWVTGLMETGANDVLVVEAGIEEHGAKDQLQRLIPYIESVIKDVDLTGRQITVDWEVDF